MEYKFYSHLHNHYDTSLKDATAKINDVLEKAKKMGYTAMSINDHGNIAGWVDFAIACDKYNIKPIFGVEGYEAPRKATEKNAIRGERNYYHTNLMAKNKKGFDFLKKLVTYSYELKNFYYKPRFDLDFLIKNKKEIKGNLIWSSACVGGRLPLLLREGRFEDAQKYYDLIIDIFGKENVYIEVQNHGDEYETKSRQLLVKFAKENNAKLLATNDIHYVNKNEYMAREIMMARESGHTLKDRELSGKIYPAELYLKTQEEMDNLFLDIPEALVNTKVLADSVEWVDFKGTYWHYPKIDLPEGHTAKSYLREMTYNMLPKKYPINVMSKEERLKIFERIDTELDVMHKMDATDYMLIDADFTQAAKNMGVPVGKGRGSACGSIVANIIDITDINPMKYELYFERFMNIERVSMPDIDSDFGDKKRQMVIDYTVNKYGKDKVAQIMTFGTVGARMAIRDTGAVLEITSSLVDKVAKLIPQAPKVTIKKTLDNTNEFFVPNLSDLYTNNPEVKTLIDTAMTIEGVKRQTGTHAAGIIISDIPLVELGSLMEQEDSDIPIFVGDMSAVDYLRLIKFDFLGLKTLTVIDETIDLVKENHGIDIKEILNSDDALNDSKVYDLISSGKTYGVFQLESQGMQSFMKDLQPKSIEDIVIGISMYRPGPIDKIPELVRNKKNPSLIQYPEDAKYLLAPILDVTYGIIVYQEECMAIVRELAEYSFGRSDNLRRAMSKKKTKVMDYEREIFIYGAAECPSCKGTGKKNNGDQCEVCNGNGEIVAKNTEENVTIKGCVRNNISIESANKIYDDMADFALYAFNKSHAAAYGILGVQTAYLLTYFPMEYYTSYLNSIISNQDKVRQYMAIIKKLGIEISKPDINRCSNVFTCDKDRIYMGLTSLKYVGMGIENAIKERDTNGQFNDLQSLLTRVQLSKREIESLIKAGALDSFNIAKRSQMLDKLEDIMSLSKMDRKNKEIGQFSLFDISEDEDIKGFNQIKFKEMEEFNPMQMLAMEKEVSGFYLSGHPLQLPEYKDSINRSTITTLDEFTTRDNRKKVKIVGIVNIDEDSKEGIRLSKSGTFYANFTLEDLYGTIKVLAFKDSVDYCKQHMFADNIVEIEGTLSVDIEEYEDDNGEVQEKREIKIFLSSMDKVTSESDRKKVYIKVNTRDAKIMTALNSVVSKHPGFDTILLYDPILKKSFKYNKSIFYSDLFKGDLIDNSIIEDCDIVAKLA